MESKNYDRIATEKRWKKFWEKEKIFQFSEKSKAPLYVVDTPPPYVSADHLHAGHIMSYAQAEFIVRYQRMRGFNVFYPMGFDDNGLPTERFVEKKYKIDKSKITKSEFIKICLQETEQGAQTYKKLWDDLGISVDWTKTYSTISPLATKVSQWSFLDLHKKGALYRNEAPVLWCPSCRTAIAQADLEDKKEDAKINSIYFSSHGTKLTIATTRPELLSACVALYVNPTDTRYKHLIGKNALVPLFDYEVPIRASEKVDSAFGTGLMMVCTWGDKEDLEKWQTDKLQTRAVLREDGRLNELGIAYRGLKIYEARKKIISDLQRKGYLIKQEDISHTLNVHERCGTPVEFILSKQWFIKIADLQKTWLAYGKKLHWYPETKRQDYELWVNSLQWDWCISRQRYYGVPFPVWYCEHCLEPILAHEKMLPVNPAEVKPPLSSCPKCGHKKFVPENDVMDTWATSSVTPFIIRELVRDKQIKKKLFPATLRPNAFEIIRTWDFYSIVKSHYHFQSVPFRDVMISGHGLDEHGRKISKRLGNYIPSEKLLEEYGADAIRYWATGAMLGQNLRFNIQEVKKGRKTTIKLWNVGRLILMNLGDFKFKEVSRHLECADIWILQEFNQTLTKVTHAFDAYAYAKAKDEIDQFFWSKFTDYYLEFIKYRLSGDDAISQQAARYTLTTVFLGIIKMYAPILPFITEELYQLIYKKNERAKSLHLSQWPSVIEIHTDQDVSDFTQAIAAIDEIRKYKSERAMPLGSELAKYKLTTKVDVDKYGEFIRNAARVKILR
ncbi:MAG: valine--tRNA ligase [Candidatus Kerfeldbacteria bacterium RIFCSPHIGHO2_02_FULL_42_14]|uniref:Valine--tRNA ligase n=1 Tax=Candidatus Kerfeldbacteria bacterium RIFCSPHIGHO2_02_FULL_42_14 TaxID=1798540 RepID=A0A1G2ANK9_9BACT|nr:MAG: valine--tRNA ligase [Candidatus Kerfeldbacteria bacterium RIFCSPHIGHO2_02_FULL_42_14]OGY81828.1 MAG: valine--tRNA ligase [Candidatus Kerfeldbacteria bacterium RIFCSPHIGHO2_12_FULL_42_13]OGY84513.1 MAG: valine--tRNA ligase [Candidatus Kerfeldbacteria bacterium RIFCSPLOWO2_02_FULL_42_19]OGY87620.1 MAG: valine--tRNA ligase [Candidatus Kerfeldbacteria bacterium RIFCSPLOWO2_12_FULL_43_9]